MKKIALTQRVDRIPSYNEKRDCLDQKWIDFIMDCGFLPIILPNNLRAVSKILDEVNVSGIILTGGNNLTKYGGDVQERDDVEKFLLDFSIERGLPLLGVCRGMQVIQDYYGISLEKVVGHVAVKLKLLFVEKELLKNSYHTMGSTKSTDEILVKARAEDGVIEAIRHHSDEIYGIMWHPERNSPFEILDINFMKEIFER